MEAVSLKMENGAVGQIYDGEVISVDRSFGDPWH